MLTLDRVSKVYRVGTFGGARLPAVQEVSFSVAPGEVVSLIGESGSGKTTIGRMILRLIPVTDGTITFDGADITSLKGHEVRDYYKYVQGVFQDPFSSFNPIFKVDHVFDLVRDEYFPDVPEAAWDAKVAAAMDDVNLDPGELLRKYPHQLSGGQLQRMLVARALLLDIRILVADEIISMLDASTRIDVLNLLGDLKARGLGILFVTHDLSLGNYISDRTVILRRGRIVEQGLTRLVFGHPTHPYTKMLLASVPHLHERWTAVPGAEAAAAASVETAQAAAAAGHEETTDAAIAVVAARVGCHFHRTLAAAPGTEQPAPGMIAVEPDHLVACAFVDDPAGCPDAAGVAAA